jgi:hypothetical protein
MTVCARLFWHGCGTAPLFGLFVPKPSRGTGYLRYGMADLGTTVRQRLLASTAGSLSAPWHG